MYNNKITILVAEDDPDDILLIQDAFEENLLVNPLKFVNDGEQLLDYLYNRGNYSNKDEYRRPGLILLDLNMPKKDGREALKEIKSDPELGYFVEVKESLECICKFFCKSGCIKRFFF